MLSGTRELTPRRTKYTHQRSVDPTNATADIETWCRAWAILMQYHLAGKLLQLAALRRALHVNEAKAVGVINALSSNDLPIYEEHRGKGLFLGSLKYMSVEEVRRRLS